MIVGVIGQVDERRQIEVERSMFDSEGEGVIHQFDLQAFFGCSGGKRLRVPGCQGSRETAQDD